MGIGKNAGHSGGGIPHTTGKFHNVTIEPGDYVALLTVKVHHVGCALGLMIQANDPNTQLHAVLAIQHKNYDNKIFDMERGGVETVVFSPPTPGLYTIKVYNRGRDAVSFSGSYYVYG